MSQTPNRNVENFKEFLENENKKNDLRYSKIRSDEHKSCLELVEKMNKVLSTQSPFRNPKYISSLNAFGIGYDKKYYRHCEEFKQFIRETNKSENVKIEMEIPHDQPICFSNFYRIKLKR